MLVKKSECGGEVVNVFAARLIDIAAGQEMDIRRLEADVPLNLPRQIHIECGADITRSVGERGNGDATGHAIHRIMTRIPPEPVSSSIYRDALRKLKGEVRMKADNIRR